MKMIEPAPPAFRLEYRLLEEDVRRYCSSNRAGLVRRSIRGRIAGLLLLAALGGFLVGICFQAKGGRSGWLAVGSALAVVLGLAGSRRALDERSIGVIARRMGIPRDLRVVVSARGVAEDSDPPRTFSWDEVVEVSRNDHQTVIRFRPAGGLLIVPDRAFLATEGRVEFEAAVRSFRDEASGRSTAVAQAGEGLGVDPPGLPPQAGQAEARQRVVGQAATLGDPQP